MVVLRNACDACHRMKRKCDGLQPCNRCRRRSRPCGYSYKQKSGPPKGSKRKLIAADEDLLENRQGRPKLLPLAMWPKDAEEERERAADATAAAVLVEASSHPAVSGINRLLAVGGHTQIPQPPPPPKPPQPPRLPGISIPPEGSASSGAGAAAAAAAVAAASAANAGSPRGTSPVPHSPRPEMSGRSSPIATSSASASLTSATRVAQPDATGNHTPRTTADGKFTDDRHAVNRVPVPQGAAQLSLEARAGAFKKAQEAAAAGMAAARAFVEGDFPSSEPEVFIGGMSALKMTSAAGQTYNGQGIQGRTTSSSPVAAPNTTASGQPLPSSSPSMAAMPYSNPAPQVTVPSLISTMHPAGAVASQPSPGAVPTSGAAAAAPAAASGTPSAAPGAPRPVGVNPPSSTGQPPHPPHLGMPQGMSPRGLTLGMPPQGMSPQGMPPMGMPMAYHPQYGMYQPYPQSLYAAYLAQYQLQQGMPPYEGIPVYEGMSPYPNPTVYGHGNHGGGTAGGAPGPGGPAGSQGGAVHEQPPALPGVTGHDPPFAVTAAAAAALAAATQNATANASGKRPPKESEAAKQVGAAYCII